ncbi:MAG TPA: hypothetical protein VIM53_03165 [Candidatus Saccharimonadales bacterium]
MGIESAAGAQYDPRREAADDAASSPFGAEERYFFDFPPRATTFDFAAAKDLMRRPGNELTVKAMVESYHEARAAAGLPQIPSGYEYLLGDQQ